MTRFEKRLPLLLIVALILEVVLLLYKSREISLLAPNLARSYPDWPAPRLTGRDKELFNVNMLTIWVLKHGEKNAPALSAREAEAIRADIEAARVTTKEMTLTLQKIYASFNRSQWKIIKTPQEAPLDPFALGVDSTPRNVIDQFEFAVLLAYHKGRKDPAFRATTTLPKVERYSTNALFWKVMEMERASKTRLSREQAGYIFMQLEEFKRQLGLLWKEPYRSYSVLSSEKIKGIEDTGKKLYYAMMPEFSTLEKAYLLYGKALESLPRAP